MKLFFVLIDGAGDKGEKTPFSEAYKPNIDFLAKMGKCGLAKTFDKDYSWRELAINGSNWGTASLLGYKISEHCLRRGPLEAYGIGREIHENEVALRINFASLSSEGKIDRRSGRNAEGIEELVKYVNRQIMLSSTDSADFELIHTSGHRGVLIIRCSSGVSDNISTTDPLVNDALPKRCSAKDDSIQAQTTAHLVNEIIAKSNKLLTSHRINIERQKKGLLPINFILTRGAGTKLPALENLSYKYKREFACIAPMPVERGICKSAGMDLLWTDKPSNSSNNDALKALEYIEKNINEYDCFFICVKGPDVFGHDGDFDGKKESIEWLDANFFKKLLEITNFKDSVYVVASDHATPVSEKRHSLEPVPFLISGAEIPADLVNKFCEGECLKGYFGLIDATKVLEIAMVEINER